MRRLRRTPVAGLADLLRLVALEGLVGALGLVAGRQACAASTDISPQYQLGAGLQSSYFHCDRACIYSSRQPSSLQSSTDGVALNNFTISGTGSVTTDLKLTAAGEYTGSGSTRGSNQFDLLVGIVRFEPLDQLNVWIGRFYTPSDRINLDGPYFTNDLTPYRNGVDDSYPQVRFGADDGIAYWGDFGLLKVSLGGFDGQNLNSAVTHRHAPLGAARVMLDFWDKEEGYLLRSSFYGASNVLALAAAGQTQGGRSAWDIDGLLDRKLGDAGVITSEFEYEQDHALSARAPSQGWFALLSYILPRRLGVGQLQPLIKYSTKSFDAAMPVPAYRLKTVETNLNYIINGANALVGVYYLRQKDVLRANPLGAGSFSFIAPQEFGLKIQFRI